MEEIKLKILKPTGSDLMEREIETILRHFQGGKINEGEAVQRLDFVREDVATIYWHLRVVAEASENTVKTIQRIHRELSTDQVFTRSLKKVKDFEEGRAQWPELMNEVRATRKQIKRNTATQLKELAQAIFRAKRIAKKRVTPELVFPQDMPKVDPLLGDEQSPVLFGYYDGS